MPTQRSAIAMPVDRFAARIAHGLAGQDDPMHFDTGAFVADLLNALQSRRYAEGLLGHAQYADKMDRLEAAQRYLEAVLERGLILVRRETQTATHALLLSLCRRLPEPGWEAAELARSHEAPAVGAAPFGEAGGMLARLAALPRPHSPGSAGPTRRAELGPLWLRAGAIGGEAPDELSILGVLQVAPRRMRPLAGVDALNTLCATLITALRSVHRPFQALCGLGRGLCPFEWLEVVSTAQVRATGILQETIRRNGFTGANPFDDRTAVAAAWTEARVPGYRDAEGFLGSDFGRALRGLDAARRADIEIGDDRWSPVDEAGETEGAFLDSDVFAERLSALRAAGVLGDADIALAQALYHGDPTVDAHDPAIARRIVAITRKLERHVPEEPLP